MPKISDVCEFMDSFAPTAAAEQWDNVGLIVGDPENEVSRIMTCLTITPESAGEAIDSGAELIVTHHPLPFRPLQRITTENTPSRLLWNLIRAGVSVYSPHTAFDSADRGINNMLGERIGLTKMEPLVPAAAPSPGPGSGRHGFLSSPQTAAAFAETIKTALGIPAVKVAAARGDLESNVSHVAVACGSGGSFLEKAIAAGCDGFVTGETTFHTCLEAQASGVSLFLTGHYASERFAVERLSEILAGAFPDCAVSPSGKESDPVQIL